MAPSFMTLLNRKKVEMHCLGKGLLKEAQREASVKVKLVLEYLMK